MVKLRVKSHVQQERNMAGVGNKFAPLPPILLNKKKGDFTEEAAALTSER